MNEIKIPDTKYPILSEIKNRWSARAFSEQPIAHDTLMQLFEAATWSFSANNAQPWAYIYAHRADTTHFDKIADCLVPFNKNWADKAAVLILALAQITTDDGSKNPWALHDLGAANMNMLTEATANNIVGHIMAGFDKDKARTYFQLPEQYEPVAVIALGYWGDPNLLNDTLKMREFSPRTRKNIADVAFNGSL
ncbi:MAG: nitroreductase family protein [Saprospiraceae bacterium]|nr:nitroreductase family protein [Saprospiraceae bacterium]MBP7699505.1 nitroreductase family protein [Saprospiraceae bacterium]